MYEIRVIAHSFQRSNDYTESDFLSRNKQLKYRISDTVIQLFNTSYFMSDVMYLFFFRDTQFLLADGIPFPDQGYSLAHFCRH